MRLSTPVFAAAASAGGISANIHGAVGGGSAKAPATMQVVVTERQVDAINDVVYSQTFDMRSRRDLKMTLFIPRSEDLHPAIVYFPGGGFAVAPKDKFLEMRYALAKAGFVVAAAEYRTIPDQYPSLVEDGKAAVRYLREHAAEFGIDASRIGVIGDSAGGYLAQMLGVTNGDASFDKGRYLDKSSDVQAVATIYGISSLLNIGEGFPAEIERIHQSPAVTEALLLNGPAFADFPGAAVDCDPAKALAASPMGHVKGSKPPFLIMHGNADRLVSPVQSQQLYEALAGEGNNVEYVVVDGADHGGPIWFQPPVVARVVDWFRSILGGALQGKGQRDGAGANL